MKAPVTVRSRGPRALRPLLLVTIPALLVGASLLTPGYSRPPVASVETGYRGTGMVDVANPRADAALIALNAVPPPDIPIDTEPGPLASEVYQNVQVLGDLTDANFTRLMVAITAWVSPEQGCGYCHGEEGNFAEDKLYTKRVARWMIAMTRHVNNDWKPHVGGTGVTCLTCHRGNPVPKNIWFEPEISGVQPGSNAMLGYYKQLYGHSAVAGDTSLSMDPLGAYLASSDAESARIRVNSANALPDGNRASTKQTEQTYALMMHMSNALGVNCTYCHNSRQFASWSQSPPARGTAWYGIRMVRDLNTNWLEPIVGAFPEYRLGAAHKDVPKLNCTTCHQGLAKPLNGAQMLPDYPELGAANKVAPATLLPGTLQPLWQEAAAPETEAPADATPAAGGDTAPAPAAPAGTDTAAPAAGGAAAPAPAAPAAGTDAAAPTPAAPAAPAEPAAPAATPAPATDAAPAAPAAPDETTAAPAAPAQPAAPASSAAAPAPAPATQTPAATAPAPVTPPPAAAAPASPAPAQ